MQCTSAYPAPYNEINLNTIPTLRNKFKLNYCLSCYFRHEIKKKHLKILKQIISYFLILNRLYAQFYWAYFFGTLFVFVKRNTANRQI